MANETPSMATMAFPQTLPLADTVPEPHTVATHDGQTLAPGQDGERVGLTAVQMPSRYLDLGVIGRGGSGEVRRVHDTVLGRDLAMKLLAPQRQWSTAQMDRLRIEAIMTAQLQHPGVVPVYDRGTLEDGRVWFTMKAIRGTTLAEATRDVHGPAQDPVATAPSLRTLLSSFVSVCQAVAYAHSRGVVHRDLKPGNIMLGEFGEVLVVDWGLAVSTVDHRPAQSSSIAGTPVYMAPEQARGGPGAEAPAVDIYALGAVLYELISGRPPYLVAGHAAIQAVLDGPPAPLTDVPGVPTALAAASAWAMSRDPSARPEALELAAAVQNWRDGQRAREEALAVVADADAIAPSIQTLKDEAAALRRDADARLARLGPKASQDDREAAWDIQDKAASREREARLSETVWLQTLRSALNRVPELAEAHDRLADHYRAALQDAEARRDSDAAATSLWLLRQHDRGQHAAYVLGTGLLTLFTEPAGAAVHIQRCVERRKRLVLEDGGVLGTTDLPQAKLAPGSYLLTLVHPDRLPVRYPVFLERQGHWSSQGPVHLPRADELQDGECYVPGGWFVAGGDPDAGDALPRQWVWVDSFVMAEQPVTVGQYLGFLNALVREGRVDDALRWQPLAGHSVAHSDGATPVFVQDADGRFHAGADNQGQPWSAEWPVTLVDWHCARAYAAWKSIQDGLPWRLPSELEREKAARGVDGRFFPWGDGFDPTFARVAASQAGPPKPAAVADFPLDTSVYGVRGLGGNTRDWCANRWTRAGPIDPLTRRVRRDLASGGADVVAVRGGAFAGKASSSRSAARFGSWAGARVMNLGFRLVRTLRPPVARSKPDE